MIRRHRIGLSMLVAIGLLVGLSSMSLAARGGGSTINLVVLPTGTARTAADPSQGSQVTFEVESQADRPFVNLRCYQGGEFVYDGWHGFFASYYTDPIFTLSSQLWTAGEADCTARLVEWGKNGRERTLATLGFHVTA